MAEKCRLCGENRELQRSHIIPNFAIKWIKKSSATSYLRDASNPNRRTEHHTIKDYQEDLLCRNCEQKFNKWESKFASNIFYPFVEGRFSQVEYSSWLQLFIISISWRIIACNRTDPGSFESPHQERFRAVEEHWRQILDGYPGLEDDDKSHYICFLGDINTLNDDVPESADFYFDRAIDAEPVAVTLFGTYVYFKFPKMCFVSCISPAETQGIMNGKVGQEGQIETGQTFGPFWRTFFRGRIDSVDKNSISKSEIEKIEKKMKKNRDRTMGSESMKTAARKYHRERKAHDPTDHLNEKCPICGFKHTVVEKLPKKPVSKNSIRPPEGSDQVEFVDTVALNDKRTRFLTEDSPQGAIILSTGEKTRVLALYSDIGYVVEEEILYEENDDPKEVGENVRDELQSLFDKSISDFFRGE